MQGVDLVVRDSKSSDPYCVFSLLNGEEVLEVAKSRIIKHTLNPVWQQVVGPFSPHTCCTYDRIKVEVFDYNRLVRDDFMGGGVLTWATLATVVGDPGNETNSYTFPLQPREGHLEDADIKGTITIQLRLGAPPTPEEQNEGKSKSRFSIWKRKATPDEKTITQPPCAEA